MKRMWLKVRILKIQAMFLSSFQFLRAGQSTCEIKQLLSNCKMYLLHWHCRLVFNSFELSPIKFATSKIIRRVLCWLGTRCVDSL